MEPEQQIEIGDLISDKYNMTRGPVIREQIYPLHARSPIPCWVIRNPIGLEQLIFKHDSKLIRKANG